ncbi:MAG: TVP38/TMEM64 family protein, partial [Robiginitomaculum sp.]
FILVNMAAGVSRMTLPAFLGGTALGVIPKIAAVAVLGQSLVGALQGRPIFVLAMAVFLALIIGVMLFARRRLKAREENIK